MVDCPSLDLLPSLVSNPAWERLYRNDENDRNISNTSSSSSGSSGAAGSGKKKRGGGGGVAFDDAPFVVHMASAEVLRSAEYARWARRFGPRAKHLVTTQPFCSPHSIFQVSSSGGACVLVCVSMRVYLKFSSFGCLSQRCCERRKAWSRGDQIDIRHRSGDEELQRQEAFLIIPSSLAHWMHVPPREGCT